MKGHLQVESSKYIAVLRHSEILESRSKAEVRKLCSSISTRCAWVASLFTRLGNFFGIGEIPVVGETFSLCLLTKGELTCM